MPATHAQLKLIDISQTIDLELLFSAAALTTAADGGGGGTLVFAPSHAGSLGLYDAATSAFNLADPDGGVSGMSTTQHRFGGAAAVAAAAGGSLVATTEAGAAARQIVVFSPANAAEVGVYDAVASTFSLADLSVCSESSKASPADRPASTRHLWHARALIVPTRTHSRTHSLTRAHLRVPPNGTGHRLLVPRAQVRRRRGDVDRQPRRLCAAAGDGRRDLRRRQRRRGACASRSSHTRIP